MANAFSDEASEFVDSILNTASYKKYTKSFHIFLFVGHSLKSFKLLRCEHGTKFYSIQNFPPFHIFRNFIQMLT